MVRSLDALADDVQIQRPLKWARTFQPILVAGVSVAAGFFLASGGVGFLLSTVHHAVNWRFEEVFDHRKWLQRMVDSDVLELKYRPGGDPVPKDQVKRVSRISAWAILTALWHERAHKNELASATVRATGLADLTHSIGTLRVVSVVAPLTVVTILANVATLSTRPADILRWVSAFLVGIVLWLVQREGYRRTGKLAREVIEQSLTDVLVAEMKLGLPVAAHLSPEESTVSFPVVSRVRGWLSRWFRIGPPRLSNREDR